MASMDKELLFLALILTIVVERASACGSPCTQCLAARRPDVLAAYASWGWDTSCGNHDNVYNHWCTQLDPSGCQTAKDGCASSCGGGGCGSPCTVCLSSTRPDVINAYSSWGWDTSCPNRDNVYNHWCTQVDPAGCDGSKRACGSPCGYSPSPPSPPAPSPPSPPAPSPPSPPSSSGVGHNPFIYGMHDDVDRNVLRYNGEARGWITILHYVGASGTCDHVFDYTSWSNDGFGVILRLDVGGAPSLPMPHQVDSFAQTFADCVAKSRGVSTWIVGNEPNLPWGHPDNRAYSPHEYADIYKAVLAAVDARGLQSHEILFAGLAPWAAISAWGDTMDGFRTSLRAAGRIDGVSIHAYSREHTVSSITSDQWFPGKENKWHMHFRCYRDFTRILKEEGLVNIPLYITEAGSVCDPPCDPYPNGNNGFFVAMYQEIDNWNRNNPSQKIRAVTPYRWRGYDDGSGRDFCISCDQGLIDDMKNAVARGARW